MLGKKHFRDIILNRWRKKKQSPRTPFLSGWTMGKPGQSCWDVCVAKHMACDADSPIGWEGVRSAFLGKNRTDKLARTKTDCNLFLLTFRIFVIQPFFLFRSGVRVQVQGRACLRELQPLLNGRGERGLVRVPTGSHSLNVLGFSKFLPPAQFFQVL